VALWQITGGQPNFADRGMGFKPLAQMRMAFRSKGDTGHIEWHGTYLGLG
jgi:hypothetical protein